MKNRWTLLSSGIKNFVYNNIKLSITSSSSSEKICHIKPKSSIVLETYLKQRNYPTWTAFYVAQSDIQNDLWGQSHFNFSIIQEHHSDEKINNKQLISRKNYHVLRTGAFPFVKFHCTLRPKEDLTLENIFYNVLKIINFGFPCLLYGIAGLIWADHIELVNIEDYPHPIKIYFWYQETH